MSSGINSLADQLLAEVSVPVVLYLIVRTSRYPPCYQRPPVAEEAVEAKDEVFFVGGNVTALDGRAKVIHPAKAAALAAPE